MHKAVRQKDEEVQDIRTLMASKDAQLGTLGSNTEKLQQEIAGLQAQLADAQLTVLVRWRGGRSVRPRPCSVLPPQGRRGRLRLNE